MSVKTKTAENPYSRDDENYWKWEENVKTQAATAVEKKKAYDIAIVARDEQYRVDVARRTAENALKPHCLKCGSILYGDGECMNSLCESRKTDEPKTKTAKTRGRTRGRRDKKESRLSRLGPYAPVLRAILRDPTVSLAAKGFAAVLFDRLNLGPWNIDLHIDASSPQLFEVTSASKSNLKRLAKELQEPGHLEMENLNRGGVRYRFTSPPVDSKGSTRG